jgi:ketosteroid isomerase-like protein
VTRYPYLLVSCLALLGLGLGLGLVLPRAVTAAQDDAQQIRDLTDRFCKAMEAGDLTIIDQIFDLSPENVFYDINEGPLSPERLKRVWTAATTNYDIKRFVFTDLRVDVDGERALETGSWEQTQASKSGESRDIVGRATILWKKTSSGWKVYHYHGSVTPRRPRQNPSR